MPGVRLAQLASNLGRARDLVGLGQAIGGLSSGIVDASDMYRAGLVQAVAAADFYFHGVILDRGVNILLGRLRVGGGSAKMALDFEAVREILAAPSPADQEILARTHLAQRLAKLTFQYSEDIASGLSAVGVSAAWSSAFGPASGARRQAMDLVVFRRNRIVHQCDADPLTPGTVTPLSDMDTLDAIATVDQTVTAIDSLY